MHDVLDTGRDDCRRGDVELRRVSDARGVAMRTITYVALMVAAIIGAELLCMMLWNACHVG
jgi:hypothetical protein